MPASYRQLMDLRSVSEFKVTSPALRERSRESPWTKPTRRAFVAERDDVFGMVRMFELLTASTPNEIRVFRAMFEALEWLGLDSEE